jgi:hypothetical protein
MNYEDMICKKLRHLGIYVSTKDAYGARSILNRRYSSSFTPFTLTGLIQKTPAYDMKSLLDAPCEEIYISIHMSKYICGVSYDSYVDAARKAGLTINIGHSDIFDRTMAVYIPVMHLEKLQEFDKLVDANERERENRRAKAKEKEDKNRESLKDKLCLCLHGDK